MDGATETGPTHWAVQVPDDLRSQVSNDQLPPIADPEEESARLEAGLRSCRTVVENYRAMIAENREEGSEDAQDSALKGHSA